MQVASEVPAEVVKSYRDHRERAAEMEAAGRRMLAQGRTAPAMVAFAAGAESVRIRQMLREEWSR